MGVMLQISPGPLGPIIFGGDDGDDDGDSGPNRYQQALGALMGASALGVGLTEDPVGFVVAVVIDWAIGGMISFAGEVATEVLSVWNLLTSTIVGTGVLLLEPFGAIGQVPIIVIGLINEIIVNIAASAGPGAPVVVMFLWAVLVFFTAVAARAVIELTPLVVPWL